MGQIESPRVAMVEFLSTYARIVSIELDHKMKRELDKRLEPDEDSPEWMVGYHAGAMSAMLNFMGSPDSGYNACHERINKMVKVASKLHTRYRKQPGGLQLAQLWGGVHGALIMLTDDGYLGNPQAEDRSDADEVRAIHESAERFFTGVNWNHYEIVITDPGADEPVRYGDTTLSRAVETAELAMEESNARMVAGQCVIEQRYGAVRHKAFKLGDLNPLRESYGELIREMPLEVAVKRAFVLGHVPLSFTELEAVEEIKALADRLDGMTELHKIDVDDMEEVDQILARLAHKAERLNTGLFRSVKGYKEKRKEAGDAEAAE